MRQAASESCTLCAVVHHHANICLLSHVPASLVIRQSFCSVRNMHNPLISPCNTLDAAGFYFVSKLMVKDLARVKSEYANGETGVSALFATALAADVLDLAAQFTVISG